MKLTRTNLPIRCSLIISDHQGICINFYATITLLTQLFRTVIQTELSSGNDFLAEVYTRTKRYEMSLEHLEYARYANLVNELGKCYSTVESEQWKYWMNKKISAEDMKQIAKDYNTIILFYCFSPHL